MVEDTPEAAELQGNVVRDNAFGLNDTDENGYDIVYSGNGTDNCITIGATDTALDRSTLSPCQGKNTFSQTTQDQMVQWVGENATKGWKQHDHPPKQGIKPLVVFGE